MTEQQLQANHDSENRNNTNSIGPDDVLLGRGGATNNHIGNRNFRDIVSEHRPEYLEARKLEKINIARKIVSIVNERGGRFLQRNDDSELWVEVSTKRAHGKTSQALREGLDVRQGQIRTTKRAPVSIVSGISKSNTRKPYTIKQNLVKGAVDCRSPTSQVRSTSTSVLEMDSEATVCDVVLDTHMKNLYLLSLQCK
jgi:hypothetical protein